MTDTDFIRAMQQGLPPIAPPTTPGLSVTEYRMDGVLLGNSDIEINNHEALWGICAEETNDEQ
ncbi:hypothetical protein BCL79_0653 [Stenotrophomonas rhizophila]|uniref:Uncharacterized protein n=1 Tax=Stenotrophomonas rhizophila TaxID=216778 RepID=A0A498CED2_9GAMM|nr:hypothetical protein [Stenotrophomonas rhizophila]RLK56269.1 hypothetical protein BCL79_0653 [Stenotrophomonas rhizophila]